MGSGWLLGETMITGIGQGYIQTTPMQLCLMTAQLANGGYKIEPKIVVDEFNKKVRKDSFKKLFDNEKNIKIIHDSMYSSTNEVMALYSSRINNPKYRFAEKLGLHK